MRASAVPAATVLRENRTRQRRDRTTSESERDECGSTDRCERKHRARREERDREGEEAGLGRPWPSRKTTPRWTACLTKEREGPPRGCTRTRTQARRGSAHVLASSRSTGVSSLALTRVGSSGTEPSNASSEQLARRKEAGRPFRIPVEVPDAEARRARVVEVLAPGELREQAPEAAEARSAHRRDVTGPDVLARSSAVDERERSRLDAHTTVQQQDEPARAAPALGRRAASRPRFACGRTRSGMRSERPSATYPLPSVEPSSTTTASAANPLAPPPPTSASSVAGEVTRLVEDGDDDGESGAAQRGRTLAALCRRPALRCPVVGDPRPRTGRSARLRRLLRCPTCGRRRSGSRGTRRSVHGDAHRFPMVDGIPVSWETSRLRVGSAVRRPAAVLRRRVRPLPGVRARAVARQLS